MSSVALEDTVQSVEGPHSPDKTKPLMFGQRWPRPDRPTLIVGLCALSVIVSVLLVSFAVVLSQRDLVSHTQDINNCMIEHKYVLDNTVSDVSKIQSLGYACFTFSGYQLMLDEQVIRVQNFVFQRHENIILLLMVVTITLSGVVLAGIQLVASYRLAAAGKGEFGRDNDLTVSKSSLSLRSSIVGLMILIVSFAFFLVFIKDVYELKDEQVASRPAGPNVAVMSGNLVTKAPGTSVKAPDSLIKNETTPGSSNDNKSENPALKTP